MGLQNNLNLNQQVAYNRLIQIEEELIKSNRVILNRDLEKIASFQEILPERVFCSYLLGISNRLIEQDNAVSTCKIYLHFSGALDEYLKSQ